MTEPLTQGHTMLCDCDRCFQALRSQAEELRASLSKCKEALKMADRKILDTACLIAKQDFKFAQGMNEALNILRQETKLLSALEGNKTALEKEG